MTWLNSFVTTILIGCAGICTSHAEIVGADATKPSASDSPWTIFTMAPDGAWGVATESFIYQGIAKAVLNCKAISEQKLGCGAQIQAARFAWIIAIRCNRTNIIVVGGTLPDTIKLAVHRELALRAASVEEISPCSHVVTVTPYGAALRISPNARWNGPELSRR